MLKKNLILVAFSICLFSCQTKDQNGLSVLKININKQQSSDLPELSIGSIVPIDSSDSALFGNISTIEYFSDRIFLLDVFTSKSLLVFSKDGSFINKTKYGKGPNELINPYTFFVDRGENNVLIYDQNLQYIFKFDLDLNFLSKEKYEGVPISNFIKLNGNKMLVSSHFYQDFVFSLYSSDYSLENQFVKDSPYDGGQGLLRAMISTNKRTLMISAFDYYIYKLTNDGAQSEYYIDFGDYEIGKEVLKKKGIGGVWDQIRTGKKVSSPMGIAESDNFLWFSVVFSGENLSYAYSLNKKAMYRLNDYFNTGDIPKCRIMGINENDVFYAIVEPSDMISYQEKTKNKLVNTEILLTQSPFFITFSISNP